MPDMQSAGPTASLPMMLDAITVPEADDLDYALGCECADPSLQIERWLQEARGEAA